MRMKMTENEEKEPVNRDRQRLSWVYPHKIEGWPCTRESNSEFNRESLNFQHSLCLDNQRSNRQAQESYALARFQPREGTNRRHRESTRRLNPRPNNTLWPERKGKEKRKQEIECKSQRVETKPKNNRIPIMRLLTSPNDRIFVHPRAHYVLLSGSRAWSPTTLGIEC